MGHRLTRTRPPRPRSQIHTAYQVGSALGLAAITAVATSRGADQLGHAAALTEGYSAAFIRAAGIAVVGAVLAAALLRIPKPVTAAADAGASDEGLTLAA
jgi:hypothetical protein